jgi:hypothetical protein
LNAPVEQGQKECHISDEGSSIDPFYREGQHPDAKAADSRTSKHTKAFRLDLALALSGMVKLQGCDLGSDFQLGSS